MATFDKKEMEAKYKQWMERESRINMANLTCIGPDPDSDTRSASLFNSIPSSGSFEDVDLAAYSKLWQEERPKFPPLRVLPCANVQVRRYWACPNPGTSACSACRLVSYCSKDCQNAHWKKHKEDCKDHLRSPDWKPKGSPHMNLLATGGNDFPNAFERGIPLWGNVPAIDLINLSQNEKDASRDFSIAFAASGDLRHVISTVNALPESYDGHLTILLNDLMPHIVARNIALLVFLTRIKDVSIAADIALHFWYSVFLPGEYRTILLAVMTEWLAEIAKGSSGKEYFSTLLVNRCSASGVLSKDVLDVFRSFFSDHLEMDQAQAEYDRVREAPSRQPERDAMYSKLRPSHRIAFRQYRRFGIILPFGAVNAHFNCVNSSLFSQEGIWLQTDYADPIGGWDVGSIVQCGKRHGANSEDIYGCFYFFMTEQLQQFAERLRKFRISFKICSMDASELPQIIRSNRFASIGLDSTLRFDRIHVSNIMDQNYVGIKGVVSKWGPLLSDSRHAAMAGYFMNWSQMHPKKSLLPTGGDSLMRLISEMIRDGKALSLKTKVVPQNMLAFMQMLCPIPLDLMTEMQACVDHSEIFDVYLKEQGFTTTINKHGLKRRTKHLIGPHRILAPIDEVTSLPVFPQQDSFYHNLKLTSRTWTERFVELVKAG